MIHSEPAAHQNGHGQGPLDVPGRVVGGGDVDGDSGGTVVPVMGEESESVPLHPLGVKPLGNRYLSGGPDARSACGSFQALPDETIMTLLEYLGADELRRLGYTCKFLFAFCHLDDLWKTLFLESQETRDASDIVWQHSWRSTLLRLPRSHEAIISCPTVFSDVLHRPFVCSCVSPRRFAAGIPARNAIARMADLTAEEFAAAWTDRPFILTDVVPRWPAFGGASGRGERWTLDWLVRRHGDVSFRAEAVDWPFRLYHSYLSATLDESPLYLFDQGFAEKMGLELGQQPAPGDVDGPPPSSSSHPPYTNPTCFGADLFALLGASRPAHRWLIAGPARSGSTFHHDPNATSAWNAVLQGSKYWVMFPPHITPPGVFVSPDGAEVTSPLSIAEWLLGFHAEARETPGCIEAVCGAGEILHVPSGWWHLVVNLEPGVAVTQNFVPQARLAEVLKFLRDRPEQVTGFDGKSVQDPYGLFVERLREACPDVLEEALRKLKLRDGKAGGKRKWDTVVAGDAERDAGEETARAAGAGFSFGFGVAGDDDVEEDDFS